MTLSRLIALLNSLDVGELNGIRTKLDQARHDCLAQGQEELARLLLDAEQALSRADMKTYRKRVETVVARLGHLR